MVTISGTVLGLALSTLLLLASIGWAVAFFEDDKDTAAFLCCVIAVASSVWFVVTLVLVLVAGIEALQVA